MILARGLGTRMQKQVEGLKLDPATSKLANHGLKGLILVGRPFLDHLLQSLLDAGITDICFIVAPGNSPIRNYYEAVAERNKDNFKITFAVQTDPLGTADAVYAGRHWAGNDSFIVLNSDNYYTPSALRQLIQAPAPAMVAFDRDALIAKSNIPKERISKFAVIDLDQNGYVKRIIEKPENPDEYAHDGKLYVSMNCFLLTQEIFKACESIEPHPIRKEYELPTAVQYSIDQMGLSYKAVKCDEPVLDLTGRTDIEKVREYLSDHKVTFAAPDTSVVLNKIDEEQQG